MEPGEGRGELPRMPRGAWDSADSGEPSRPDYAGWWARAGAVLVDNLILAVPWLVAVILFVAAADDDGDGAGQLWTLGGFFTAAAVLIPFVYFTLLHGSERGQTLGKRVAGIRVQRRDGSRLGAARAFGRYALTFVFSVFLGPVILVDYLWPLWDAERQTLHDKAVDSIVVRL